MGSMPDHVRPSHFSLIALYGTYVSASFRSQMAYRASFAMLALGQFAVTGAEFLGIWALFARFRTLQGWTLAEICWFYGVVGVAFAIAEAVGRGFDMFPALVKSGEFDRLLVRPLPTAFQVAAAEFQLMRVGRLLQAALVLTYSLTSVRGALTVPHVALTMGSIMAGACVFTGLFVVQATLSFWTIDGLEIMNTVTYGGTETAQYPLSIYRPGMRFLFTFVVPLACATTLPASAVLGRASGQSPLGAWLGLLLGPIFLVGCLCLWRVGVRHYRSSGS